MPQIIAKMYDFLLYIIPQISKFPRSERYTLGERIQEMSCHILDHLLEAVYSSEKLEILKTVNIELEKLRYYIRLCKDLKLINLHKYEVVSKMINDVGVQLGGSWNNNNDDNLRVANRNNNIGFRCVFAPQHFFDPESHLLRKLRACLEESPDRQPWSFLYGKTEERIAPPAFRNLSKADEQGGRYFD